MSMIKRSDLLKYLRIKYTLMDPSFFPVLILLLCLICFMLMLPENPIMVSLFVVLILDCLFLSHGKQRRLNDYLIMVRYPFSHCFYLYQRCSKKRKGFRSYEEARETYLFQMRQVLKQLPPGHYKTVTQPMFTRAIRTCQKVTIIDRKRAYRKKIVKLLREIYFPLPAPDRTNSFKQFYYIEFWIKKTIHDKEQRHGCYCNKSYSDNIHTSSCL